MAEAPTVLLKRMSDGRHAVMSPDGGQVYGLHNSLQSATRQVADYFKPVLAEGQTPAQPPSGPPTNADLRAGMDFGQALSQAHPHANAGQLIDIAHGMEQHQVEAKMQAQHHQQQLLQAQLQPHPGAYPNALAQRVAMEQRGWHQQNPLQAFAQEAGMQPQDAQRGGANPMMPIHGSGGFQPMPMLPGAQRGQTTPMRAF